MFFAPAGPILSHDCIIRYLRVGRVRRFQVFDYRCLLSIARIGCVDCVNDAKFRNRLLDVGSENTLSKLIEAGGNRWLGHVFLLASIDLPCRNLFFFSHGVR